MTDRSQGERMWRQVDCSLAVWTRYVFFFLLAMVTWPQPPSDGRGSCHHGPLSRGCGSNGQSTSATVFTTRPSSRTSPSRLCHFASRYPTVQFSSPPAIKSEKPGCCPDTGLSGLSLIPRVRWRCGESRWERTPESLLPSWAAEVTSLWPLGPTVCFNA